MRVWLMTIGEPLPTDGQGDRLLRTSMLAETLEQRGHDVVWWTSTFDHVRKRQRFDADAFVPITPRYSIHLLHARPYRRNVGLGRVLSHRAIAGRFASAAGAEARPDVILCSLPTIELCVEAVRYGHRFSVPVVIDVRDLWPDVIADLAPKPLRSVAEWILNPMFQSARACCAAATAIVGTTQEYVDWGLKNARRAPAPLDRPFAMAYRSTSPAAEDVARAEELWDDRGVMADPITTTVCFFGTIGRHFDLDCVIESARELQRAAAAVRFVICGNGEHLDRLRSRAADCRNVLFPGWVGSAEIWTLMRRSALGLAPFHSSRNFVANLTNKPIEYLSAGLPIVSSLQGVLARLLQDNDCGLTYQNGNSGQLTRILLELSGDPQRRAAMSRRAAELYEREFVAERVYSGMAEHLERIAVRRSRTDGPSGSSSNRARPPRAAAVG